MYQGGNRTLLQERVLQEFERRRGSRETLLAQNEAELRDAFAQAVALAGIHLRMERDRQDARLNRIIIEFETPGSFGGRADSQRFQQAFIQLRRYIAHQARVDGWDTAEYIGVAFDGFHIAYVFLENAVARYTPLVPLNAVSCNILLAYLAEDRRRALTIENMMDDFGLSNPNTRSLLQGLWTQLAIRLDNDVPKTRMLFTEWRKLFAQVADLTRAQQSRLNNLGNSLGIGDITDFSRLLFVLHTYNAILLKLLAAELASSFRIITGNAGGFCAYAAPLPDETLWHILDGEIERSVLFRRIGIHNFIEGDFFTWYLTPGNSTILEGIRGLLQTLARYKLAGVTVERTRDLLKRPYEGLVLETMRKNLGEFYTPDWLAEFTLDRVGYVGERVLETRLLDPTCGSGTFLILAIRRFLATGRENGLSDEDLLRRICTQIVGFDLNPLAVISARVNYLLAIAELLTTWITVEIPVYLADAIYAPTVRDTLSASPVSTRTYRIGTTALAMDVELPEALIQQLGKFTAVLDLMETDIVHGLDLSVFQSHLQRQQVLTLAEADLWGGFLGQVYEKIAQLHSQEWNRIWCRIVRNYFASVAVGRFDLIVGNPPWVRWSKLPDEYRTLIKSTCESYHIFSDTPYHGGNELDISGMIVYTSADKWLKKKGKLAFVITQSHFQAPSSQGVRRFRLVRENIPLKVISVDDFQAVKPFPRLTNKPAVLVLEKGQETAYPVEYRVWQRSGSGGLPEDASWEQVRSFLESRLMVAMPVAPNGGCWSILPPSNVPLLGQLKGGSPHLTGRKGVTTDLNGVYFIEVLGPGPAGQLRFRNTPESGITPLGLLHEGNIESDLVFPFIKGAGNIRAFRATLDRRCLILPNRGIHSLESEAEFAARYHLAYEYFSHYRDLLARRSTYRLRLAPHGVPFYAVYNVGPYTFKPWKVVWAEVAGSLQAAVISQAIVPYTGENRPVVPDHKVFFVAFDQPDKAHFVCALLNSTAVRTFVDSFTVKTQVGDLFKVLRLPRYDKTSPLHCHLADLSLRAHRGEHLQEEIDTCAQEVIEQQTIKDDPRLAIGF